MSGDALHLGRHVDPFADVSLRIVQCPELGAVKGVFEVHLGAAGHQLGDLVYFVERDVQGAPYIAHSGTRTERSKGDDIGDLVDAVLGSCIVDEFLAAIVGIVEVHVRHGHPLGVEKALKDQIL